ncbi:BRCA1-A complex subunit Abraxas 1-like [Parambassis ranga]|uniref:BRCA1-A complex subunit Abraxas 1-like n=1 Tax=Parambassis ranga TaxID=210632 RepID=A0A6P7JB19_9TELE|nr:BRCA1-A complex subunit Abraxas 1-like [Parambassis ranga]XP_028274047.1 BRCA1-A complex subunit Abraxas 1-like [Parambassis ranga]
MAEPTVRLSGIVLASLMFQHVNSDSDVEGLVLGESRFEEQVTISDSQPDHIHIEETYSIQKHIACSTPNTLYSSAGDVNMDALQKMLADNKQDSVIGWYRQRRNTEQQMTFREKLIHENLKSALSNPHMIFLLLTPSTLTPPGSTHRTEYSAFISRSRRFMNLSVLVNNLGLLEQLAYWKVSAPCSAAGYSLTMRKHGSRFFSSDGLLKEVSEVNRMNDSLQVELQKACTEVEESERLVEALQVEVSALRRRLRKEQSEAVKGTDSFSLPEQKNNLLLQEAIRALLGCSPLFCTQTLTVQAFPVPDQDVSTATQPNSVDCCRKRPRESQPEREWKRRRSEC